MVYVLNMFTSNNFDLEGSVQVHLCIMVFWELYNNPRIIRFTQLSSFCSLVQQPYATDFLLFSSYSCT